MERDLAAEAPHTPCQRGCTDCDQLRLLARVAEELRTLAACHYHNFSLDPLSWLQGYVSPGPAIQELQPRHTRF